MVCIHISIHVCEWVLCVWWFVGLYMSMCLTLGTCVGMSLSMFLYLNVCRGGRLNLCSESPIHMYTVPSSGHQQKAPQDSLEESRIWITSNSRLVPWQHTGQSFQDGFREVRRGIHLAGNSVQGPACRQQFIVWGERTPPLVWRQGHWASTW